MHPGSGEGRLHRTHRRRAGGVLNHFTFESVGMGGYFTGPLLSGVFAFTPPNKGDCMSEPLTVITVSFAGVHG